MSNSEWETMFRTRALTVAFATATAVAGMMVTGAGGAQAASAQSLAGSAIPFASHNHPLGTVAAARQLTIQVWLTPRNAAAASNYATAVSTPGSSLYHHYLSPNAFTSRFAATTASAGKVRQWLMSKGFTNVTASAQRDYVRATANTAKINAAFGIQMKYYQSSATARTFSGQLRGYSGQLSIPASLTGNVLAVTGLDNAAPSLPMATYHTNVKQTAAPATGTNTCSRYYDERQTTALPKMFGETHFPTVICGYGGQQMRAVYGANGKNTGKGQTIALVELGLAPDMFTTLQDWGKANNMRPPSTTRYRELSLGDNSCGDPFFEEEQLDVEASYAMAPDSSQIVVGGDGCDNGDQGLQGLFNADLAVINGGGGHPLASVASNSWGSGGENQPAFLTNIEHAYLVRAAAVGVGMYFSSGDSSGVFEPASDPFAISVGGTTLGINKSGHRLFESGWSTGVSLDLGSPEAWTFFGEQFAAGGGPSEIWAQPGYQKHAVPRSLATGAGNRPGLVRSVPDISADADPYTGFNVGLITTDSQGNPAFIETSIGGTSLAAPLVAGMVIAAQQGQPHTFGFTDPVLYRLYHSNAFFDPTPLTSHSPAPWRGLVCPVSPTQCGLPQLAIHDDQNRDMAGYTGQVTLRGYDNMTGLGTPNGQSFIGQLRRLEP